MTNTEDTVDRVKEQLDLSEQETRIIRKAYRAFVDRGAQQLTLRGVAREIGVSPSLIVYHFGTYQEMVWKTLRWALDSRSEALSGSFDDEMDLPTFIEALTSSILVGPEENRAYFLVYLDIVQFSLRNEDFSGLSEMWRSRVEGFFADALRAPAAVALGADLDVGVAAARIRTIFEGSTLQWIQDPEWEEHFDELVMECHDRLLAYLPRLAHLTDQ